MQFELTEKQYRRLLDMVYIGNYLNCDRVLLERVTVRNQMV